MSEQRTFREGQVVTYTYTDPDGDRIEFRELPSGEVVIAAAGIGDIAVLPASERARAAEALTERAFAPIDDVIETLESLPGINDDLAEREARQEQAEREYRNRAQPA